MDPSQSNQSRPDTPPTPQTPPHFETPPHQPLQANPAAGIVWTTHAQPVEGPQTLENTLENTDPLDSAGHWGGLTPRVYQNLDNVAPVRGYVLARSSGGAGINPLSSILKEGEDDDGDDDDEKERKRKKRRVLSRHPSGLGRGGRGGRGGGRGPPPSGGSSSIPVGA